jgi:hypothetical protein
MSSVGWKRPLCRSYMLTWMAMRSMVRSPVACGPRAYCWCRMCLVRVIRSVAGGSSSVTPGTGFGADMVMAMGGSCQAAGVAENELVCSAVCKLWVWKFAGWRGGLCSPCRMVEKCGFTEVAVEVMSVAFHPEPVAVTSKLLTFCATFATVSTMEGTSSRDGNPFYYPGTSGTSREAELLQLRLTEMFRWGGGGRHRIASHFVSPGWK